jgi:hypothetical protein
VNTDARSSSYPQPSNRTLVDIGAEERNAMTFDRTCKAVDFEKSHTKKKGGYIIAQAIS